MGRRQILHQVEEKGLRIDRPYSRLRKTGLMGDDHDASDVVQSVESEVNKQSDVVEARVIVPDVVEQSVGGVKLVDAAPVGTDAGIVKQSSEKVVTTVEAEKKPVKNALKDLSDSKSQPKTKVGAKKPRVPPAPSDPSQEA